MKQKSKDLQNAEKQEALAIKQQERKRICTKVLLTKPNFTAGMMARMALRKWEFGDGVTGISLDAASDSIKALTEKIADGDLSPVEEVLFAQIKWMEQLAFSEQANMCVQAVMPHRLAVGYFLLKIQEQTRKTAATLAQIKQGPRQTTFVKQQNQAVNQQVNNLENYSSNVKNELLGEEKNVDSGTSGETGGCNPALEAVVVEYRAKDRVWQSESGKELDKIGVMGSKNDRHS